MTQRTAWCALARSAPVIAADHLKLRLVQLADERHVSDYDLVQVLALPVGGSWLWEDEANVSPALQTDITFDGSVSGNDLAAFADYFENDAMMADYNGSGSVDVDDVIEFLEDWSEAQP